MKALPLLIALVALNAQAQFFIALESPRIPEERMLVFQGQSNQLYSVERSTNLVDWTLEVTCVGLDEQIREFVGTTNVYGSEYWRVRQDNDLVTFPDYFDYVDQSMELFVDTQLTNTLCAYEVLRDGVIYFAGTNAVPESGRFVIGDGWYNPDNWPYDGYYNTEDWEYRLIFYRPEDVVMSLVGGGGWPAPGDPGLENRRLRRKGRLRDHTHNGSVVWVPSVLGQARAAAEDDIQNYMQMYYLSVYQTAFMHSLLGSPMNEFSYCETVENAGDMGNYRRHYRYTPVSGRPFIDYTHYMGHGASDRIGDNTVGRITLLDIAASRRNLYPMAYVALDGCHTIEEPDFFNAVLTMNRKRNAAWFRGRGADPRFGIGWEDAKAIVYVNQGTLVYKHFNGWVNYYTHLTYRNVPGSWMLNTYEQAIAFAQDPPPGGGFMGDDDPNGEWDDVDYVGCGDCWFDL